MPRYRSHTTHGMREITKIYFISFDLVVRVPLEGAAQDMSDVESDEEGTRLVHRSPKWRSEALNAFIANIDATMKVVFVYGEPSERAQREKGRKNLEVTESSSSEMEE